MKYVRPERGPLKLALSLPLGHGTVSQEMTEQLELGHTAAWLCMTEELEPGWDPAHSSLCCSAPGNKSSLFFPRLHSIITSL